MAEQKTAEAERKTAEAERKTVEAEQKTIEAEQRSENTQGKLSETQRLLETVRAQKDAAHEQGRKDAVMELYQEGVLNLEQAASAHAECPQSIFKSSSFKQKDRKSEIEKRYSLIKEAATTLNNFIINAMGIDKPVSLRLRPGQLGKLQSFISLQCHPDAPFVYKQTRVVFLSDL